MRETQARLLRAAFLAGAITDALAVVPMLVPPLAALLWGFDAEGAGYRFAMHYGATLMAGWTGLLLWAYRRPLERSFIAPLTVAVIYGLALSEIHAVFSGQIAAARMIPTWILQAGLLALFATAYHYPLLRRVLRIQATR
jgi:hypothetical protein